MSNFPVSTTTFDAGISFIIDETDPNEPFFLPGTTITTLEGGTCVVWAKNLKTQARLQCGTVNIVGPKKVAVIFGGQFVPVGKWLVEADATPVGGALDAIYVGVWEVTESPSPPPP